MPLAASVTPLVYVSGCHSGPNPSPGLGVARSLRLAFPGARLIGKDHSPQSSGLHDPVFDDVWVCQPWDEIDLSHHRDEIARRIADGGLYISGLDIEVGWLSGACLAGALLPSADAIARTSKPAITAFADLPGVAIPAWCALEGEPRDMHRFARTHDWRVWVKGPAYEAELATDPRSLAEARHKIETTWGAGGLHVQADMRGREVSITFAAYRGELLDAVFMEKRLLTSLGKTWTGRISGVPADVLAALRARVAELHWTGGAELEFVLDERGALWLVDFNARFPAWIHGATLAGHNLPGRLVSAAIGGAMTPEASYGDAFTRVVTEIPVRRGLPPPPLRAPAPGTSDASLGKNPSGMPRLFRRLHTDDRDRPGPPAALPRWATRLHALDDRPTPFRWLVEEDAGERFERCGTAAAALSGSVDVRVAYSVKTNPALVDRAKRGGFLAEIISAGEHAHAAACGFTHDEIVLNGPLAGPLAARGIACGFAFADSNEALRAFARATFGVCGPRLRPPGVSSRFGIDADDPREFGACVDAMAVLPGALGVSMHAQSSVIGLGRWTRAAEATIDLAAALRGLLGRPIACLDLGGGWSPDDADDVLDARLPALVRAAAVALPGLETILVEPGKLLADVTAVTVATVLEVRRRGDGAREAVVDASIAELPMCHFEPHRLVVASRDRTEVVASGGDRVLGRLCMEADVLRTDVRLPTWLAPDDRIVFCDTGGYDASMAFTFGKGRVDV